MAGISLLDQLASSAGDDTSYMNADPFYQAGRAAFGMQMPAPQTNAQAIFEPLLKGVLAGGLMGYGKEDAYQKAYNVDRANPLIQALTSQENIGPVASGDAYANSLLHAYSSPDMPDSWTPAMGKNDTILGAIAKESQMEQEQKKADLADQLQSQISLATNPDIIAAKIKEAAGTEQAKADAQNSQLKALLANGADKGNLDAAILLAPKSIQAELTKEKTAADKLDSTKQLVTDAFDRAKDAGTIGSMINPWSTSYSNLSGAQADITTALQDLAKSTRIPPPILRQLMEADLPHSYQTNAQIDIEKKNLLNALEQYRPSTPMLNAITGGSGTGQDGPDLSAYSPEQIAYMKAKRIL